MHTAGLGMHDFKRGALHDSYGGEAFIPGFSCEPATLHEGEEDAVIETDPPAKSQAPLGLNLGEHLQSRPVFRPNFHLVCIEVGKGEPGGRKGFFVRRGIEERPCGFSQFPRAPSRQAAA